MSFQERLQRWVRLQVFSIVHQRRMPPELPLYTRVLVQKLIHLGKFLPACVRVCPWVRVRVRLLGVELLRIEPIFAFHKVMWILRDLFLYVRVLI